jgi:hypothetical protein
MSEFASDARTGHSTIDRPLLRTSSNFEAEERLAELRAEGKSKAHLKSINKHGSVHFQVYSH